MNLLTHSFTSSPDDYLVATFRTWCLLGVIMGLSLASAEAQSRRIFVGTYTQGASDGIYTCLFDEKTGELSEPVLAAETVNPTFLTIHPDRPLLICCNEVNDFEGRAQGALSVYRIAPDTGKLEFINQQPTGGAAPCHLTIDATGRFVLTANYFGGSTTVLPIADDGSLKPSCCFIQHEGSGPNKQRQEMPHAHSVNLSSDNRFAYVADLGTDRIWTFLFDETSGQLTPASPDSASVAAGGGPRHFDFSLDERFAWSNNELTSTVTTFERDPESGQLSAVQELSTLPAQFEGNNSTAECRLHPNGRFVYVSNRGHDSLAVYAVGDDGRLSLVEISPSGGQEPRNFYIVPGGNWLLSENQNSDSIVVFAIGSDGRLTQTSHSVTVGNPVCIRMLQAVRAD